MAVTISNSNSTEVIRTYFRSFQLRIHWKNYEIAKNRYENCVFHGILIKWRKKKNPCWTRTMSKLQNDQVLSFFELFRNVFSSTILFEIRFHFPFRTKINNRTIKLFRLFSVHPLLCPLSIFHFSKRKNSVYFVNGLCSIKSKEWNILPIYQQSYCTLYTHCC